MRQKGFTPLIILIVVAIIGVAGYFTYKNYFPRNTDWPTYIDQTRNYSFQYPPDEKINEIGYDHIELGGRDVENPLYSPLAFRIFENKNNDSIRDWFKAIAPSDKVTANLFQDTSIDGNSAVKYFPKGSKRPSYYIKGPRSVIVSVTPIGAETNYTAQNKENDLILSTFKFLGQISRNLKTYLSKDGSYSMEYPADWIIADASNNDGKLKFKRNITFSNFSDFANGVYSLHIENFVADSGACLFPDSPSFSGPSVEYIEYTEFNGPGGIYRRVLLGPMENLGILAWTACRKEVNSPYFMSIAGFGEISYNTPQKYDPKILSTMDAIVASIVPTKK